MIQRLKKIIITGFLGVMLLQVQAIEVVKTTCEYRVNPLDLTTTTPRFGWQMKGANGTMQSAYAIEVYALQRGAKQLVWESGKQTSNRSQFVPYQGETLQTEVAYVWRVRVWDEYDEPSAWSKEETFRLAPQPEAMKASWIGAVTYEQANFPEGRKFDGAALKKSDVKETWANVDSLAWRSILLRKEFKPGRKVTDAIAYVCGLGHYEFTLNGTKVGDGEFTPLWSDYEKTVYYNTYDVTSLVRKEGNAIGILLGNGFYNVVGGGRYTKLQVGFGPETLFFRLKLTYEDGTCEEICSGADWKYTLSPITFHSMYGGEDYDARLEQTGWNQYGFKANNWKEVIVQRRPKGELKPQQTTPVTIARRYDIKEVHKLTSEEIAKATKATKRTVDSSALLLDMGQNLSGFPEISVKGKRGQRITLVVSESLVDSCHAANQRQTGRQHYYTYILKGDKKGETWHPRFSYYGFRYIQVEGAVLQGSENPEQLPVIDRIQSCFIHNAAAKVSSFECSNAIFTQAHELIYNAMRSNMQSVLTDCPHREKLGWLEQDHLNGPGLLYNFDLTTYFPKIIQDIVDTQRPNGMVPTIAPQYVSFDGPSLEVFNDSPEWGSTLVIVPFMYYETYGDDSLIRNYYRNMRAYVDYLSSRAENHLIDFGLGDWYDYGNFRAGFSRNTPIGLVASAHYYMDLIYLAQAADLVGNAYDQQYYTQLAQEVKDSFNAFYLNTETHQYGTGSQCSNALPLFLNMVPEEERAQVLNSLVEDIKKHGTRLTTGDVGNRYLFQTLARNGLNELMYALNNHEEAPGYGFQLKFGATTLTEQWDPRQGSSWNHFMMGQIDEWFFHSLGGIQQGANEYGYQHLVIRPEVVGDLQRVNTTYETLYGEVKVAWNRQESGVQLEVTIPVNCTADVYLPHSEEVKQVKSGTHTFYQAF